MGTTINLDNDGTIVDASKDTVIVTKNLESVRGGRALDVTGFAPKVVNAGHVIITDTATKKIFKPMPVNAAGDAYETLPDGYEYAHVQINTVLTSKAAAGLLIRGTVNHKACVIEPTAEAMEALGPLIIFKED
ncbi:hypothetical protein M8998_07280 [Sphingobacterium sp. lm-10]|uniref:hypothetical protein n=1 Tax=Sphingobacterium sp. lm-10 TaxID=2944904 RepID=UPI0020202964|nr:hypothetical protein [Sphingobacterium sp. lm-10]MCL7987736.1 hypothetical protein [Sphingobacterium sp. lm-10]